MADPLVKYRAKRDFRRTAEPAGAETAVVQPAMQRRFVVHKHAATRLHYDLRLEHDGVLLSWAVTRGPSLDPKQKRLAVEVEPHPLEYGEFEGIIPKGEYGGGTVMIWDKGFWSPELSTPIEKSIADGELKFVLAGEKLQGSWVLVRLKPRAGDTNANWLLIKHRDRWATPGTDDLGGRAVSVTSHRTMAQIAAAGAEPHDATAEPTLVNKAVRTGGTRKREVSTPALKPLRLTHPERVLWPSADGGITKRQLTDYYSSVAPQLLEHIRGRPCSLVRAPDGIDGEHFFQRHAMPGRSNTIKTVKVDGDHAPYLQIDDEETLVGLAQISALEIHPWNCVPDDPKRPGRLIFDLDPGPGVSFDDVIAAAKDLRSRIEHLGLVSFCKTTGGKGLHVVTPLIADPQIDWPQAKLFAQTVCVQMADDSPTRFTTKMTKTLRTNKIYLDYLRNDATSTAVAPFSPRARPGAPVSMPVGWGQLRKGFDPQRFTLARVPALLTKSSGWARAWAGYADGARPLSEAIRKLLRTRP